MQVSTTVSPDPNATTTKAPYRISRNEFSRILRRNVKGLVRLFNLELDDALKVILSHTHFKGNILKYL